MLKKFIQKRWEVAGYYNYSPETRTWDYDCDFYEEKTVWEFDGKFVRCYYSDSEKPSYTVPYTVIQPDSRLLIDYWRSKLHFDPSIQVYYLETVGEELYLCEIDFHAKERSCQAIKLVPVK